MESEEKRNGRVRTKEADALFSSSRPSLTIVCLIPLLLV